MDVDVLGPVDYLVVEFPAEEANFSGEMAVRRSGGQLVANGRIPTQALLATVAADEKGA